MPDPRLIAGRLQASAAFRAWAVRQPLLRPAARHASARLFALCAGAAATQTLRAVTDLALPDALLDGPRSAADLAAASAVPDGRMERLLDAAAATGLLRRRRDGRYALAPLGAALVDNDGLRAMIRHGALLYDDLRDPAALLRADRRETALARFWRYGDAPDTPDPPDVLDPPDAPDPAGEAYPSLMARSSALVAALLLDSWPFGRHRHALDVGGADGAFAVALARHAPALRVTVVDLPAIVPLAAARVAASGLASRVDTAPCDARRDRWPAGADLAVLLRVLHDHDDADAMRLLRAARASLPPGATLLVAEPMSGGRGAAAAASDAYFALYFLAMGQGRLRAPRRIRRMLNAAGFPRTRLVPTALPLLLRVVAAS